MLGKLEGILFWVPGTLRTFRFFPLAITATVSVSKYKWRPGVSKVLVASLASAFQPDQSDD